MRLLQCNDPLEAISKLVTQEIEFGGYASSLIFLSGIHKQSKKKNQMALG